MKDSYLKPNRLDVFSTSLLNKLSALARNNRKRRASKTRRQMIKKRLAVEIDQVF